MDKVDKQVIDSKLESLRRCLARIRDKAPSSADELAQDLDLQDIITVNLQRAVQVCVDVASHLLAETDAPVPDTMAGTFDSLVDTGLIESKVAEGMTRAVGFRNIAVHAYRELDWGIVYTIVNDRLGDFVEFGRAIERLHHRSSRS